MIAEAPVMVLVQLLIFDKNHNPKGNLFLPIIAIMAIVGFLAIQLLSMLVTERVKTLAPHKESFNYFKTLAAFFKNKAIMGLTICSM